MRKYHEIGQTRGQNYRCVRATHLVRFPWIGQRASAGSLRVWMAIGFLLISSIAFLLWPVIQKAELNIRLTAADQKLADYRVAVLAYYAQKGVVPMDVKICSEPLKIVPSQGLVRTEIPNEQNYVFSQTTLGQSLIEAKRLERITFPLGKSPASRSEVSLKNDPVSGITPKILAIPADYLEKRYHRENLFSHSGGRRIAVLLLTGLRADEAVGLQRIVGLSPIDQTKKTQSDCIFSLDEESHTFTAWVYLQDL